MPEQKTTEAAADERPLMIVINNKRLDFPPGTQELSHRAIVCRHLGIKQKDFDRDNPKHALKYVITWSHGPEGAETSEDKKPLEQGGTVEVIRDQRFTIHHPEDWAAANKPAKGGKK